MSAGRARTAISILVVFVLAAILGWFMLDRSGPDPRLALIPSGAGDGGADRSKSDILKNGVDVPTSRRDGPANGTAPAVSADKPGPNETASKPQTAPAPSGVEEPGASAAVRPSFDIVRVEPTGESVVAGRASPGATVDLLRNGEPFARAIADATGLFAFVPPAFPPGSHEIVLRATSSDKGEVRSAQSVTVVIAPGRDQVPLVTVTAPDQPTVVLSRPDAVAAVEPSPASPPRPAAVGASAPKTESAAATPAPAVALRIATVEAQGTGRLLVSGEAQAGATIRLYLNDTFVAPGATGPDGRLAFTIERGIRPGDYRVRLDQVDPVTGAVKSRAEVPFHVPVPATPEPAVAAATPSDTGPRVASGPSSSAGDGVSSRETDAGSGGSAPAPGSKPSQPGGAPTLERQPSTAQPGPETGRPNPARQPSTVVAAADPAVVVVPELNTAIVSRGDNLWRISKRIYGEGLRYTVIFGANTPQIRNPDLIYPGQVFVLPSDKQP